MKILKRILLGVLSVVCVGAMAVGFAGCGKDGVCQHEYDSVVLKEATCEEKGLRTKVCTLCGDDFSEIIHALGHDYRNHEEKSATCTEDGWGAYQTCSRCAYSTYEKIPAFGHSYTNYADDGNATCTQDGTKTALCDNGCRATDVQVVKAHHKYENHICVGCGDILPSEGLQFALNEDGKSYSVSKGSFTETQLFIPNSYNGLPVTTIGDQAFYNCESLTSVVIGNSVTSIGDRAFYYCRSLTSVVIGNSVTTIGHSAFSRCTSLTSVVIGNNVTSIGYYAFSSCASLTSIVIPDSITSIGNYAFSNCDGLTSIVIPDSVTSIDEYAFCGCASLTSIWVSKDNENYQSIDGNLYSKDGKTLIQYAIGKTATSFTVPDSVTTIGDYAFYDCSSLTSIEIPDSVTSIGDRAFYYCTSLTSVVIGNSVTSIGDAAFRKCSSLTSIEFTGTVAQWNAISKGSYWKDSVYAMEVVCKDGTVAI